MKIHSRLLSFAIASALAVSVPAVAAQGPSGPGGQSQPRPFTHAQKTAPAAHGLKASRAVKHAQVLLQGPAARAIHRTPYDRFESGRVVVDHDGAEHVRFKRTYRGLPVIGGDFVVHAKDGRLKGVSQTLHRAIHVNTTPKLTRDEAIVAAGTDFGSKFTGTPGAHLVVYALDDTAPVLAYEVTLSGMKPDQTPTHMHYFVDAKTGKILNKWDTVRTFIPRTAQVRSATPARSGRTSAHALRRGAGPGPGRPGPDPKRTPCRNPLAAVGTGNSLTEGVVPVDTIKCGSRYKMVDFTRGGGKVTNMGERTMGDGTLFVSADNVWGNGGLYNSVTVAADAHYGISMTWDYYKQIFGRNGIADNGEGALGRVHYGRYYFNAFWSDVCFCMSFGDGDNGLTYNPLVALDVAGHEMSHGVTARTSGLIYSGEPGGLNEANSDIMGTMVEWFADNPSDPPDYEIGEKVYANNPSGLKALRYMFKPSLDGTSPDCYYDGLGSLDVHYSSGVANHFYYLLAAGDVVPAGYGSGSDANLSPADLVCNGDTSIKGVGRADAEHIWYRGMTVYMTSDTDYADAREATLHAASDLFGDASRQYQAVAAAWSAVNVN